MNKEPRFGAAIPKDEWIQRTVTTDPNPRIKFSIQGAYPYEEIKMPFFEHLIAGAVFGFAIGAILFS